MRAASWSRLQMVYFSVSNQEVREAMRDVRKYPVKPEMPAAHLSALRRITGLFGAAPIDWAITGSCNLALQGVLVEPIDLDVQTDRAGAYAIKRESAPTKG